jgi:hypothetical protein
MPKTNYPASAKLKYENQSGIAQELQAGSNNAANAVTALTARAAKTVGTAISASQTVRAAGVIAFSDSNSRRATLLLTKTNADNSIERKMVFFPFLPLTLLNPDLEGKVLITDAKITEFATAFYDGYGNNGYACVDGWYL